MSVAKQLYQLQEVDLKLESNEQALNQIISQLGESQAVLKAQAELRQEEQHLEELRRQLHSAEWELDDLGSKIATLEQELYSGRIKNPKELANLQHEVDGLKARRAQLEDRALEVMDQVEAAETSITDSGSKLKGLEADWHSQQQQQSAKMEQVKARLADLKHKRQLLVAEIDAQTVEFYQKLKKNKGQAVAKVEQGICHGCRISLSTTELQQARAGNLVQCSSCGRILFLA